MYDMFHEITQRVEDGTGKTVTTEVELVSYVKDRSSGTFESRYYVKHSNRQTVLEQGMTINRDGYGNYDAIIVITHFPAQKSPEEAALKLADWLKRLGESIEANFKKQEVDDA
ncbi:hypothetical protein C3369_07245 [Escherichia sp. ESNIH1]|uniref:hypothetical protein n=1 Tax=Escherichia sp. ESNIH1 TaxID=1985876 RepID=UPI000CDDA0B4|nr:hypothetical protein [Escherichia sp. ESNIH1]POU03607.1 hypothetical protein C3369_07245 [Escherichia sp. ESNIH1]